MWFMASCAPCQYVLKRGIPYECTDARGAERLRGATVVLFCCSLMLRERRDRSRIPVALAVVVAVSGAAFATTPVCIGVARFTYCRRLALNDPFYRLLSKYMFVPSIAF